MTSSGVPVCNTDGCKSKRADGKLFCQKCLEKNETDFINNFSNGMAELRASAREISMFRSRARARKIQLAKNALEGAFRGVDPNKVISSAMSILSHRVEDGDVSII